MKKKRRGKESAPSGKKKGKRPGGHAGLRRPSRVSLGTYPTASTMGYNEKKKEGFNGACPEVEKEVSP